MSVVVAGGGGGVHSVSRRRAAAGSGGGVGSGSGAVRLAELGRLGRRCFGGVGRRTLTRLRARVGRRLLWPRRRGGPFVVGHGPLLVPRRLGAAVPARVYCPRKSPDKHRAVQRARCRTSVSSGSERRSARCASRSGLSQRVLAMRIGRSQAYVSLVERGRIAGFTIVEAEAIRRGLGATLVLGIEAPVLVAGSRQRDAAHARCVAYVARRLIRDGWIVRREVQIGTPGRPGWIDVLAYNPESRVLLVIEVKTELTDLGGLERQLGWYSREARRAVRGLGWNPIEVAPVALLLSTKTNDDRIRENAAATSPNVSSSLARLDGDHPRCRDRIAWLGDRADRPAVAGSRLVPPDRPRRAALGRALPEHRGLPAGAPMSPAHRIRTNTRANEPTTRCGRSGRARSCKSD